MKWARRNPDPKVGSIDERKPLTLLTKNDMLACSILGHEADDWDRRSRVVLLTCSRLLNQSPSFTSISSQANVYSALT